MLGVLADCHKIEVISEKIYQKFAASSNYSPEIRKGFQKLASDEKNHASEIDLLIQSSDYIKVDAVSRISGQKVDDVLKMAEKILFEVEKNFVSEEDALNHSIEMEQEFIKIHAHNALLFNDQRLSDFFDNLGREDLHHIETLKGLMGWWKSEGKSKAKHLPNN